MGETTPCPGSRAGDHRGRRCGNGDGGGGGGGPAGQPQLLERSTTEAVFGGPWASAVRPTTSSHRPMGNCQYRHAFVHRENGESPTAHTRPPKSPAATAAGGSGRPAAAASCCRCNRCLTGVPVCGMRALTPSLPARCGRVSLLAGGISPQVLRWSVPRVASVACWTASRQLWRTWRLAAAPSSSYAPT
ncbi:hypothetical protein I4F81_002579 [Pyropia yezoensis]|uniref:Uncharacterized protein n=1 Tax=Pyropia yezoensis TaxID=2788 RepID=A0ACC3BQ70_PYRYE|nr:hypothetical protein I4F81_002579 [Neopyropia yezoensis]